MISRNILQASTLLYSAFMESLGSKPKPSFATALVISILVFASSTSGQRTGGPTPEQNTAQCFERLKSEPLELLAFLKKMPKGADLHSHLSGATYAESYILWAAEKGWCVDEKDFRLLFPPCDPEYSSAVKFALTEQRLRRKIIEAWSMQNWPLSTQSGHDHFYEVFARFGPVTFGQNGVMLAEVVHRAAENQVIYLELMLSPDVGFSSRIGQVTGWDGNFEGTLEKLKGNGIAQAALQAVKNLQDWEAQKDQLLKCGTPQADPGCLVSVRYIYQVPRATLLSNVYAQLVTGFILANDPTSRVVALNLVQAEDSLPALENFSLQMQMLHYLGTLYPKAHVTLHAGELTPELVPREALRFHIRESINTGRAERIGLGVDLMYEDEPFSLLEEMAGKNIMVEICLSSNYAVLGVRGKQHPLSLYLKYGVPVALATDDEGVLRTDMTHEYLKAVEEHGLGYIQLKMMARNSLEYAFLDGTSLWKDARKGVLTSECLTDVLDKKSISVSCRQFLAASEKARLQWRLENEFVGFEKYTPACQFMAVDK